MAVPSFTDPVVNNGYRWWYLDAVSDDGEHAITVIVFIGSVFSPYYARARKKGGARAAAHCAVNVALYGAPWRWCMTEREDTSVSASARHLSIGNSGLVITQQGKLEVNVEEIAVPVPSRMRGRLTIDLPDYDLEAHCLDAACGAGDLGGQHYWQPIAPQTRISVDFDKPDLHWKGTAYVDSNYGSSPLESSFKSWVWSRSHTQNGETVILYDVINRQGNSSTRSLRYAADGTLTTHNADTLQNLPPTRYWRVPRQARTGSDTTIEKLQTLEDTPFYSRSRFTECQGNQRQTTIHESLYLDRFSSAWVQCLLPFRMPRNTRPVLIE